MKNQSIRNRVIWGVGAFFALSLCYVVSRHDVFGRWHSMIQWPIVLFVFGTIIIVVAALFNCRKVMSCTSAGYIAGFLLAMLLNNDYAGPGDLPDTMSYNNAWIIWTLSYLVIIIAGLVWDIIAKRVKKQKG